MNIVCLFSLTVVLASILAISILCCFCIAKENKEIKRDMEELLESIPQRSMDYMKSEESSKRICNALKERMSVAGVVEDIKGLDTSFIYTPFVKKDTHFHIDVKDNIIGKENPSLIYTITEETPFYDSNSKVSSDVDINCRVNLTGLSDILATIEAFEGRGAFSFESKTMYCSNDITRNTYTIIFRN